MAPADPKRNRARALIAALSLAALGGCVDPASRASLIEPTTGDALAFNKAVHIINPWPRESFDTRLPSDGQRSAYGISQYRSATPLGGKAAASSATQ